MTWPVDPAAINTALLIGVAGYLWRQSRKVDELRQALVGMVGAEGGGLIGEVKLLRQRSHELASAMQVLNLTVEHLTTQLVELKTGPWDGQRRRKGDG